MKTDSFAGFFAELEKARSSERPVLLVTHERPDGDAAGSLTAMYILLSENGYPVRYFFADAVPDSYRDFLPAEGAVSPASTAEINENFSLVFNTDASTIKRLGLKPADFAGIRIPFLTLDHHPDNELFGNLSYIDPVCAAASEIVFRFAKEADWKISPAAATSLLLGITTDTGGFRYSNTTPAVHRAAAELLELGADNDKIVRLAFMSKPFNMAMFEAELFRTCLRTALNGKFVWITIPKKLLVKYSIDLRNTEQLIELIRNIEGVEAAALLKHTSTPGIFHFSLRSKNPEISVGRIARRLNGGGHEMAAGGTIFASNTEHAEDILLKNVEQEFNHEK